MTQPLQRGLRHALCLIALAAATASAWSASAAAATPAAAAASKGDRPAASASPSPYQRDQARCMRMRIHGERANCLSEASTAQQARKPSTVDPDPGRYARNAIERCKPLPEPDRSDCVARMQGQGTTSGSVSGGGISRELVTRVPGK